MRFLATVFSVRAFCRVGEVLARANSTYVQMKPITTRQIPSNTGFIYPMGAAFGMARQLPTAVIGTLPAQDDCRVAWGGYRG
jgi:hypothetical protein